MKNKISPQKLASLIFSVLVLCFAVVNLVLAWNSPGSGYPVGTDCTPPNCNVPAPINVGDLSQQKIGPLVINTGNAPTGLLVPLGRVGIGTISPAGVFQVNQPTTGPGLVSTTLGATTVTGPSSDVKFKSTFKVGDKITINKETHNVSIIKNDAVLITDAAWQKTNTNVPYTLIGGPRLTVLGNGNVGIGTTTPNNSLTVLGGNIENSETPTVNALVNMYRNSVATDASPAYGGYFFRYQATNNPTGSVYGVYGKGGTWGASLGKAYGVYGTVSSAGTGGTLTNAYSLYADTPAAGTSRYGLYIAPVTGGTTNYALYSAGGQSYFAGNVGIGTTTPGYKLDVNGALRLEPSSAPTIAKGAMYFDTAANKFKCSENGTTWVNCVGSGSGGVTSITAGTGLTALPSNPVTNIGTLAVKNTNFTCDSGEALRTLNIDTGAVTCDPVSTGTGISGTATQVAFFATANTLGSDANFYWDNTNKRLGIGTTTPYTTLDVKNIVRATRSGYSDLQYIQMDASGNNRIIATSRSDNQKQLEITNQSNTPFYINSYGQLQLRMNADDAGTVSDFRINNSKNKTVLAINDLGDLGGNVGIGTTTPDANAKLDIAGRAKMTGFQLTGNGAAAGFVLTASSAGVGTWASLPASLWTGSLTGNISNANSGNVGIGTTSPIARLSLGGGVIQQKLAIYDDGTTTNFYGFGLRNGYLDFQTSGTTKMTISSTGNVGIGTTTPAIDLAIGDTDTGLNWISDGNLAVYTNNLERMRIANNGNVGIGTTTPGTKLDIAGTAKMTGFQLTGNGAAANSVLTASDDTGVSTWKPLPAGLWTGSLTGDISNANSGKVGIGTTNPKTKFHVQNGSAGTPVFAWQAIDDVIFESDDNSVIQIFNPVASYGVLQFSNPDERNAANINYSAATDILSLAVNRVNVVNIKSNGNVGIGTIDPNISLAIGDTDTGLNWISDGNLAVYTNNSERMRVNSSGNVGIGTTTINGKLDVAGKILAAESTGTTNGGYSFEGDGSYDTGMFSPSDGVLDFYNNGNNRVRITSAGDVGIGTTTPQGKLGFANNGSAIAWSNGTAVKSKIYDNSDLHFWTDDNIHFDTAGTSEAPAYSNTLYISGGNVGIGTTGPAVDLAIGDTDTGLNWISDGNIAVYTNNLERMRVNSSGLDIAGTAKMTGFQLTTGANNGYILTSDGSGVGTWKVAPTSGISSVTINANNGLTGTDTGTTFNLAVGAGAGISVGPDAVAVKNIAFNCSSGSLKSINIDTGAVTCQPTSSGFMAVNCPTGEALQGFNASGSPICVHIPTAAECTCTTVCPQGPQGPAGP